MFSIEKEGIEGFNVVIPFHRVGDLGGTEAGRIEST